MSQSLDFTPLQRAHKTLDVVLMIIFIAVFFIGAGLPTTSSGSVMWRTLAVMAALVGFVIFAWVRAREHKRAIEQFAAINQLVALDADTMSASIPLCFKDVGYDYQQRFGYTFPLDNRSCNIFEFEYTTGSGKSRQTHTNTIMTFALDAALPHMFLDGKQNGVNYAYSGSQRLQLEGDFNDYFSLYIPDGSQVEALSVFTPDVMQTLIAGGRPFDIEINGRTVYVVATRSLYDPQQLPAALEFLLSIDKEFEQKEANWQQLPQALSPAAAAPLRRGLSLSTAQLVLILVIGTCFIAISQLILSAAVPAGT